MNYDFTLTAEEQELDDSLYESYKKTGVLLTPDRKKMFEEMAKETLSAEKKEIPLYETKILFSLAEEEGVSPQELLTKLIEHYKKSKPQLE